MPEKKEVKGNKTNYNYIPIQSYDVEATIRGTDLVVIFKILLSV